MQKCIDEVKTWMTVNTLKLIDDTTEAMIVSSGRKSSSLSYSFPESVYVRACVRACVCVGSDETDIERSERSIIVMRNLSNKVL